MSRLVRRFVVWLLVAIVPVQGYAVVTMAACGPIHERMSAATTRSHAGAVAGVSHHGGSELRAHDHRAHEHGAREVSVSAPQDHGVVAPAAETTVLGAERAVDFDSFSCSVCAACCVGAVVPAGEVSLEVAAPSPGTLRPSSAARLTAVTLDGPDRPPRLILA